MGVSPILATTFEGYFAFCRASFISRRQHGRDARVTVSDYTGSLTGTPMKPFLHGLLLMSFVLAHAITRGESPASAPATSDTSETLRIEPGQHIVFLGDSTTQFVGLRHPVSFTW